MSNVITLLTDFGTRDTYVAQMKAVLMSRARGSLQIIDISHEAPPQDIRRASQMLCEVAMIFPPGTVHMVVVDPGVGSKRRILAVEFHARLFVLPDNGLLSDVVAAYPDSAVRAHAVDAARLQLEEASRTFHGRDIMAPVAAFLAAGGELADIGPVVTDMVQLPRTQVSPPIGGWLEVQVASIDRFGNVLTDLHERELLSAFPELTRPSLIEVQVVKPDNRFEARWVGCYADARLGDVVALIGSQQRLELAVVNGSATRKLEIRAADRVRLRVQKV